MAYTAIHYPKDCTLLGSKTCFVFNPYHPQDGTGYSNSAIEIIKRKSNDTKFEIHTKEKRAGGLWSVDMDY